MASILIRHLDEPAEERLRILAAQHGRSVEEEACQILRAALTDDVRGRRSLPPPNLAAAIHQRFAPLGGVELPDYPRKRSNT